MERMAKGDHFKFHYVVGGNRAGFRATKGLVGDRALILGEDSLPYDQIVDTTTRGNRVILALSTGLHAEGKIAKHLVDGHVIVLEASQPGARAVEMAIDRRCAELEAARARAELEASGQQHLIRTELCPTCGAQIDLSGLEPTPYVYCRFCESIFTADRKRVTTGERYRICDECNLFDRIQEYPEFYFYFFLIVYGFSYKQRFLCDGCAHRLFLRALALNAIFLIGIPTAVWVKLKSLAGRDPDFALLAEANALARAGRHRDASIHFERVLRSQPDHPAVLRNQALGHAVGGDENGAVALLKKSLSACNHYVPVLRLLH